MAVHLHQVAHGPAGAPLEQSHGQSQASTDRKALIPAPVPSGHWWGQLPTWTAVYLTQWGQHQDCMLLPYPQLTGVAIRHTVDQKRRTQNQTNQLRPKWMECYAGTTPSRQATSSLVRGRGRELASVMPRPRWAQATKTAPWPPARPLVSSSLLTPRPPSPASTLPLALSRVQASSQSGSLCCSPLPSHLGPASLAIWATAPRPFLSSASPIKLLLPGAFSSSPAGETAPSPWTGRNEGFWDWDKDRLRSSPGCLPVGFQAPQDRAFPGCLSHEPLPAFLRPHGPPSTVTDSVTIHNGSSPIRNGRQG